MMHIANSRIYCFAWVLLLIAVAFVACRPDNVSTPDPPNPEEPAEEEVRPSISSIQIEEGETFRVKKEEQFFLTVRIAGNVTDSVRDIMISDADHPGEVSPYCRIVSITPFLPWDSVAEGVRADALYRFCLADNHYAAEYNQRLVLCYSYLDAQGMVQYICSEAFVVEGRHYDNLIRSGLPVLYIETPNRVPIVEKETYIEGATFTLLNADFTYDTDAPMKVRGRGNSSWDMFPKKPYKIHFEEKQSPLGMKADKKWALIANYSDKTQIRNGLAYYMGEKSCLDYTPAGRYVEVVLNGTHVGTYLLSETVRESKHRVDVGDDGYLLEVDMRAADPDVYFRIETIINPVVIKWPETTKGSPEYLYIKNRLNTISTVLYGSQFKDPENGYRKYIDVDSWIDWALINEIGRNGDAACYASCFMHMKKDGKLMMGPIWDFDLAYGNYQAYNNSKIEGLYIFNVKWIKRMMEDPYFRAKAKERMDYYNSHRQEWMDYIDTQAGELYQSQQLNEAIWHTMNQSLWPGYTMYTTYDENVSELKKWINRRMDWLQNEFQSY